MGDALALSAAKAFLVVACAVAGAAQDGPPSDGPPKPPPAQTAKLPELPARAPVAGIRVLETSSTLLFAAAPEARHTLVATYAFPDRARLFLTRSEEPSASRELRYRYGPKTFALGPRDAHSRELLDAERIELLRDLELRRAVFLWPDGCEWKADGSARTASLGELGTLRATIAAGGGRPERVELVAADGAVALALDRIVWVDEHARSWPASFEGWRAGRLAWKETVDAREVAKSYVDAFFAPADRREDARESDPRIGVVRPQDLSACAVLRVELRSASTWEQARAEARRLQATWEEKLRPLGLALDPNSTIEVDERGVPHAIHVRLAGDPAHLPSLPDGFARVLARSSRVMFLDDPPAGIAAHVEELRRELPAHVRALPAYLRIPAVPGPTLLVLPFVPMD